MMSYNSRLPEHSRQVSSQVLGTMLFLPASVRTLFNSLLRLVVHLSRLRVLKVELTRFIALQVLRWEIMILVYLLNEKMTLSLGLIELLEAETLLLQLLILYMLIM